MNTETLTYDPAHMDKISALYQQCADHAESAIGHLDLAWDSFSDSYNGQAKEMAWELFAKTREHTALLRDGFTQMGTFVTRSKDNMVERDHGMAAAMGK